jgi:hypothetical protein
MAAHLSFLRGWKAAWEAEVPRVVAPEGRGFAKTPAAISSGSRTTEEEYQGASNWHTGNADE